MEPERIEDRDAWPALQAALVADSEGRRVLTTLVGDPDRGAEDLRSWLVGRGDRIVTTVLGGHIERLVNIGRVEALTIAQPPPPVVPRQLRAAIGDFVGRDAIANQVIEFLLTIGETPRIAQLSGPAGIGKTTLALQVANRIADRFADGQLYADLRGGGGLPRTAVAVLAEFLRGLGLQEGLIPTDFDERQSLLRTRSAGKALLFVLDNASDEAQVRPLLPGTPSCAVLITARRWLSGLDGVRIVALPLLSQDESYRLVEQIVGSDRTIGQSESLADLVQLTGRLPLALRIAATRLAGRPDRPISWMVDLLRDEHRVLEELHVGDRDVRATFRLSYRD